MIKQLIYITLLSLGFSAINYNIMIVDNIPVNDFNSPYNFGVSDVWGYTDETGREYAIVGYKLGTFIYDVSSEFFLPELILDIPGPSSGDYYFHRDYKTYGDYLYIVNEMSGSDEGMQVVDLSPLPDDSPIVMSTYTSISHSHNLWIDSTMSLAFIEHNGSDNIHIVDLSEPDSPVYGGTFGSQMGDNCHDIYTRNEIAYISEGYSWQYGIYDISDIQNIQQLAQIYVEGYAHNAWLNDSGSHLITTEETEGKTIKIWNISDLNNINLDGEYLGENLLAHNVHVKNNQLIISHYTTGIKIVDIFNPQRPVEVAAYDTYPQSDGAGFFGCWGVYPYAQNNYIYASDMQNGLYILNYNPIYAGWTEGFIFDAEGELIRGAELKSLLNGKLFTTNNDGRYDFGFSEGENNFELIIDDMIADTVIISFYAHEEITQNIYLGNNSLLVGDINQDSFIDILDIIVLINVILGNEELVGIETIIADVNEDGLINVLDIIEIVNTILNGE